jgi:hypothetical protein
MSGMDCRSQQPIAEEGSKTPAINEKSKRTGSMQRRKNR